MEEHTRFSRERREFFSRSPKEIRDKERNAKEWGWAVRKINRVNNHTGASELGQGWNRHPEGDAQQKRRFCPGNRMNPSSGCTTDPGGAARLKSTEQTLGTKVKPGEGHRVYQMKGTKGQNASGESDVTGASMTRKRSCLGTYRLLG